jgi:hypothetical protein
MGDHRERRVAHNRLYRGVWWIRYYVHTVQRGQVQETIQSSLVDERLYRGVWCIETTVHIQRGLVYRDYIYRGIWCIRDYKEGYCA